MIQKRCDASAPAAQPLIDLFKSAIEMEVEAGAAAVECLIKTEQAHAEGRDQDCLYDLQHPLAGVRPRSNAEERDNIGNLPDHRGVRAQDRAKIRQQQREDYDGGERPRSLAQPSSPQETLQRGAIAVSNDAYAREEDKPRRQEDIVDGIPGEEEHDRVHKPFKTECRE